MLRLEASEKRLAEVARGKARRKDDLSLAEGFELLASTLR